MPISVTDDGIVALRDAGTPDGTNVASPASTCVPRTSWPSSTRADPVSVSTNVGPLAPSGTGANTGWPLCTQWWSPSPNSTTP